MIDGLRYGTFSILARDAATGQFGAAIASRLPCVGSFCVQIQPAVGAVVTQAWTNPALAHRLLEGLAAGHPSAIALELALADDVGKAIRQIAVVDRHGRASAFTGEQTDGWRGHHVGEGIAIQGNMLVDERSLDAMLAAYRKAEGLPFARRLKAALMAGFEAGGDVRGNRSAALKVFGEEVFPLVDLRVDHHEQPMIELCRLFDVAERELFPFVAALPTRENPRGRFEDVRAAIAPKPEDRR